VNPALNEDAYNAIILGGVRSPGVVVLSGFRRECAWDVKEGGAQDGAATTRKGQKPAKGTATFRLVYDPTEGSDQLTEYEQVFVPLLRSSFDKSQAQALTIYHPDLAMLGVTQVVVETIGQIDHDGKGGGSAQVGLLEYVKPKPKPASRPKAKASSGVDARGNAKPDPNAAAKAELAALLAEARKP
jgi:hypothetical protein